MSKFYYNDWCTYKDNNLVINDYVYDLPGHSTLKLALIKQATIIHNSVEKYSVFISGGIDSHTKALGFLFAGIPIELVFIKNIFEGKSNDLELFYVTEFCRKYSLHLTIYTVEYTKKDIQELIINQEFMDNPRGSGCLFQFDAMNKYVKETGRKIVTGHGHFSMRREGNRCFGSLWKPDKGIIYGLDLENVIVFDMYAPHVFYHYEYVHRNTPEIQLLKEYEAKNLSYTELGLPFRPKLSGWEFLCDKDYSTLNTIDWSDDHSKQARLARGPHTILKSAGVDSPEEMAAKKPSYSPEECYEELYSFEANRQFP